MEDRFRARGKSQSTTGEQQTTAQADCRISRTDGTSPSSTPMPKATVGYQSAPHIQAAYFMRHH
jgi:hypothetical protein